MTVHIPRDALDPIRDFLAEQFVDAGFPFNETRVDYELPPKWDYTGAPQLLLADDGGPAEWPITTRPTVRATAWGDGRTVARDIAGRALGLLLCSRIPGVAQVLPGASLIDARDKTTGAYLASFTVRARVRTVTVA